MAKQIVGEEIQVKGLKSGGIEIVNDAIFREEPTVEEAFDAIEKAIMCQGYKPTNKQFDLLVESMVKIALPDGEREWFRECATGNRVPLWLMLFGHWRRSQEQGAGFTLFLDPGWEKLAEEK